jgi:hypothetical protein
MNKESRVQDERGFHPTHGSSPGGEKQFGGLRLGLRFVEVFVQASLQFPSRLLGFA